MSTVAFIDSSLSELWKFKVFASTRLSSVYGLDRPGGAICGSEINPFYRLKSDQGPSIIWDLHPDVCSVGKAGSIARPATPSISDLFQFDRPSVEGGRLIADLTAINPQETINPQNVRAS